MTGAEDTEGEAGDAGETRRRSEPGGGPYGKAREEPQAATTTQLLPTPRLDETLVMAAVAGSIDGLGFLLLSGLFAANMTGNSVKFGLYVAKSRWDLALASGLTVPLFAVGVLIGALTRSYALRRGAPARAVVLGLEAVLVAAFTVVASLAAPSHLGPEHGAVFWSLALLALVAMGLQSALKPHIAGVYVRMTFVTGTVVSLAEACVDWILGREREARRTARRRAALFAGVWTAYTSGALIGAFLEQRFGPRAMLVPLLGLIVLVARESLGPQPRGESQIGKVPATWSAGGSTMGG